MVIILWKKLENAQVCTIILKEPDPYHVKVCTKAQNSVSLIKKICDSFLTSM